VEVEQRVYVEESERHVVPDIAVIRTARQASPGSAVLEADEPLLISTVSEPAIPERFLQIVDTRGRKLVTQIEFISHTTKRMKRSRKLYLKKRAELKNAGVNVVEIDLLRAGRPLVDLPIGALRRLQPFDYVAGVLRQGQTKREAYPIPLRQRLPRVAIPLRAGVPDIVLDVQAALDHVWDHGAYPDRIDYEAEPVPALSPEDRAWADQLLRAAGLRHSAEKA